MGKFLPAYYEQGILDRDPFDSIDVTGVGTLVRMATESGRVDLALRSSTGLKNCLAASGSPGTKFPNDPQDGMPSRSDPYV